MIVIMIMNNNNIHWLQFDSRGQKTAFKNPAPGSELRSGGTKRTTSVHMQLLRLQRDLRTGSRIFVTS